MKLKVRNVPVRGFVEVTIEIPDVHGKRYNTTKARMQRDAAIREALDKATSQIHRASLSGIEEGEMDPNSVDKWKFDVEEVSP